MSEDYAFEVTYSDGGRSASLGVPARGSAPWHKLSPTPGHRAIAAGLQGESLPLETRVDLVQQGRERLQGEDRSDHLQGQALRSGLTGGAVTYGLTRIPTVLGKGLHSIETGIEGRRLAALPSLWENAFEQMPPSVSEELNETLSRNLGAASGHPQAGDLTRASRIDRMLRGDLAARSGSPRVAAIEFGNEAAKSVGELVDRPYSRGEGPIFGKYRMDVTGALDAAGGKPAGNAFLHAYDLSIPSKAEQSLSVLRTRGTDVMQRALDAPLRGVDSVTDSLAQRLVRPRRGQALALLGGAVAGALTLKREKAEVDALDTHPGSIRSDLIESDFERALSQARRVDPTSPIHEGASRVDRAVERVTNPAHLTRAADLMSLAALLQGGVV